MNASLDKIFFSRLISSFIFDQTFLQKKLLGLQRGKRRQKVQTHSVVSILQQKSKAKTCLTRIPSGKELLATTTRKMMICRRPWLRLLPPVEAQRRGMGVPS